MSMFIDEDDCQKTEELCPNCEEDYLVMYQRGRVPDDISGYYYCLGCHYTETI